MIINWIVKFLIFNVVDGVVINGGLILDCSWWFGWGDYDVFYFSIVCLYLVVYRFYFLRVGILGWFSI